MVSSVEQLEMEQFYRTLKNDVLSAIEQAEDGGISEDKFTEMAISFLTDAGETENATSAPNIKENIKGQVLHKVNGYAIAENYENLDLFITIYNGSEEPSKILKDDVATAISRCTRFLKNAINGYMDEVEESSPIYQLALTLKNKYTELLKVNMFILTDGIAVSDAPEPTEFPSQNIAINYHLCDLTFFYRLNASKIKRIPIEIDFETHFGGVIPCICVPTHNDYYESYLAVISGTALAAIYQRYGSRLLEQNVRSFLQFTGKINKGISKTLKDEPHMFFAFNNGIAATAHQVAIVQSPNVGTAIKSIMDLQIVNGGQTTASLFYTQKKDKSDLSKVFVQMKLSVIKNPNQVEDIIPQISKYSNTQNKVTDSDLSSNGKFHIEIEKLSRNIWASKHGQRSQTRWFFERARGQYKDALTREFTAKKKELFLKQNPKQQMFTKEEMAKYVNCWDKMPYFVVRGSQKNYAEFMKNLKKNEKPNSIFLEDMIAKGILFKEAEKIYGVKQNAIGDMRFSTVPYTIAWLNHATNGKIDLFKIWKNQEISENIRGILRDLMQKIEMHIKKTSQGSLYTEWAKKEDCWKIVVNQSFIDLSVLKSDLLTAKSPKRYEQTEADLESEDRLQKVQYLKSIPISVWRDIKDWGYIKKTLSGYQDEIIFNIYKKIESLKPLTDNEIKAGLNILEIVRAQKPDLLYDANEGLN